MKRAEEVRGVSGVLSDMNSLDYAVKKVININYSKETKGK